MYFKCPFPGTLYHSHGLFYSNCTCHETPCHISRCVPMCLAWNSLQHNTIFQMDLSGWNSQQNVTVYFQRIYRSWNSLQHLTVCSNWTCHETAWLSRRDVFPHLTAVFSLWRNKVANGNAIQFPMADSGRASFWTECLSLLEWNSPGKGAVEGGGCTIISCIIHAHRTGYTVPILYSLNGIFKT